MDDLVPLFSPLFEEFEDWKVEDNLSEISKNEEIPDGFQVGDLSPISSEEEMEVDLPAKIPKKRRQKKPRKKEDIMVDSQSTEISKSLKNISKLKSPPAEAKANMKKLVLVTHEEESTKQVTPPPEVFIWSGK